MSRIVNAREAPQPTRPAHLQPCIMLEIMRAIYRSRPFPSVSVDNNDGFEWRGDMRRGRVRGPAVGPEPCLVVMPKDRSAILETGRRQSVQPVRIKRSACGRLTVMAASGTA